MSREYLNNKHLETVISRFQKVKREKTRYEMIILSIDEGTYFVAEEVSDRPITMEECVEMCQKLEVEYERLHNILANEFFTLSDNLARYAKFNHIDIDDAVQEGVMICFEKIDRFNPDIGKAFNYMTTCILNHFRQLYRTARTYNEFKKKYHDHLQTQVENQVAVRKISKLARSRFGDMG